jgi:hypothetical protein
MSEQHDSRTIFDSDRWVHRVHCSPEIFHSLSEFVHTLNNDSQNRTSFRSYQKHFNSTKNNLQMSEQHDSKTIFDSDRWEDRVHCSPEIFHSLSEVAAVPQNEDFQNIYDPASGSISISMGDRIKHAPSFSSTTPPDFTPFHFSKLSLVVSDRDSPPSKEEVTQATIKKPGSIQIKKQRVQKSRRVIPEHKEYVNEYHKNDVLGGRGTKSNEHAGNKWDLKLVRDSKKSYRGATNEEKRTIVGNIVETIRGQGGRFLEQDKESKRWYVAHDITTFTKVAQALRDENHERHPVPPNGQRAKHAAKAVDSRVRDKTIPSHDETRFAIESIHIYQSYGRAAKTQKQAPF